MGHSLYGMDNTERRIRLGKNIRAARLTQDITQRDLSKMSSVAQSYLAEVELGRRSIGFDKLCQIADALNVKPEDLIKGC